MLSITLFLYILNVFYLLSKIVLSFIIDFILFIISSISSYYKRLDTSPVFNRLLIFSKKTSSIIY